jgi:phospholipid transport system substrate-binding protein
MPSSQFDRRRALLVPLAAAAVLVGSRTARAAAGAEAAQTLIEQVSGEVLGILSDQGLSDRQKFDALVTLLSRPIDLDLVARLILGRHWRTANDPQRREYLELFREYALANLASKLHLYQGQSFEVTGAKAVGEQDALVTSRILDAGQAPLPVDWRLRDDQGGRLVVIDVIVAGVSLIVTLRSEFSSVIERQGFEGLLAELRQRITATRQQA